VDTCFPGLWGQLVTHGTVAEPAEVKQVLDLAEGYDLLVRSLRVVLAQGVLLGTAVLELALGHTELGFALVVQHTVMSEMEQGQVKALVGADMGYRQQKRSLPLEVAVGPAVHHGRFRMPLAGLVGHIYLRAVSLQLEVPRRMPVWECWTQEAYPQVRPQVWREGHLSLQAYLHNLVLLEEQMHLEQLVG
jgi:hypothetical protein